MAQHYPRAPSSKSRAPVDDWPQHRGGPYPPGQAVGPGAVEMSNRGVPMPERGMERGVAIERGVVGGGGMERGIVAPGMGPGTRLNEVLDAVRSQFDGVLHDNAALMKEREDFESQASKQINELTSIKNAVQELESVHQKARQQYEDELARLRAEIQTLRAQVANPPPGASGLGLSTNQPSYGERGRDNAVYDREPKRLKGPMDDREQNIPTPHRANPDLPSAANGGTNDEFPGSLSPSSLPANLRKEGNDWFAMYNPKIPKVLDISLLHQFNHESVVCCVRFSKDGRWLATGCNRTAQIFDMRTGGMVCQLNDEKAVSEGDLYIRSVCFSPDGKLLATGAEDRQIRIWDIAKKRIRRFFEGHEQEIYSLDFSSDGNLIVSGSGDKTARIWNMSTGDSTILSINDPTPAGVDGDVPMQDSTVGSDAGVTSVAISPDGRLVAAGSLDTIVRLWDVATGQLLERLRGHKDSVYSVAFTPDGRGLVSGSLDKTLKYWELNTAALRALADTGPVKGERSEGGKYAKCTFNFVGHKDYVLSVAISHDGQWVVSGSKDRGVQFWDKNGAPQLMLQGHKNSVISIDLSPGGGQLATGSGDWQARVWSYTTGSSS